MEMPNNLPPEVVALIQAMLKGNAPSGIDAPTLGAAPPALPPPELPPPGPPVAPMQGPPKPNPIMNALGLILRGATGQPAGPGNSGFGSVALSSLGKILPLAASAGLGAWAGQGHPGGGGAGALQAIGGYTQQKNQNQQVTLQKQQLEQQRQQQQNSQLNQVLQRIQEQARIQEEQARGARQQETADYEKSQRPASEQKAAAELKRLNQPPNIDPNSPEAVANRNAGRVKSLAEQEDADILAAYAAANKTTVDQLTPEQKIKARANGKKMMDINGEQLYPVVQGDNVIYVPRSKAGGMSAPRTLFNLSGTPSVGGKEGMSTIPPPPPPAAVQEQLSNMATVRDLFSDVEPLLNKTLGPAVGRIKLAEIDKLGGAGATPEEIDLANKLQRLITTQAFQNGGKQLTETELEQFKKLTPNLSDTVKSAQIKTKNAIDFLDKMMANRVRFLSPRQKGQFPQSGESSGVPSVGGTFNGEKVTKVTKIK